MPAEAVTSEAPAIPGLGSRDTIEPNDLPAYDAYIALSTAYEDQQDRLQQLNTEYEHWVREEIRASKLMQKRIISYAKYSKTYNRMLDAWDASFDANQELTDLWNELNVAREQLEEALSTPG